MNSEESLDQLLAETVDGCRLREERAFDELAEGSDGTIVLLGAGRLGHKALAALTNAGKPPIAIADNNAALWGTAINGVPVLSPAEAAERHGKTSTFVVTIWRANDTHRFEQSRRQLEQLGCARISSLPPFSWKYAEGMLPHFCLDLPHRVLEQRPEVRRCFALLSDARSRREFVAQMRFRLLGDLDGLPHPEEHATYFPRDVFAYDSAEAFVDAGAYDGDTLRSVLKEGIDFASYVALEPDRENCNKLRDVVASLAPEIRRKVEVSQLALFSRRARMRLVDGGTMSATLRAVTDDNADDVQCIPLDELLGGRRVTFFKLDIEGAEPDALLGAREAIRRHRPVIAISLYHEQDHLWRLPLLIASLAPDYNFYVRPYMEEGFELVCYAVPAHRVVRSGTAHG